MISKGKKFLLIAVAGCLLVSGCRLRKKIEVVIPETEKQQLTDDSYTEQMSDGSNTEPENFSAAETDQVVFDEDTQKEENLRQIILEAGEADIDTVTQAFLGKSAEEAENFRPENIAAEETWFYEVENKELVISGGYAPSISFCDDTDWAGSCYSSVIDPFGKMSEYPTYGLRRFYPEEELENCSREEVLEKCEIYAKACGYTDCVVSTYAITLNALDKFEELIGFQSSAPSAGEELIRRSEKKRLEQEGKTEEAEEYWSRKFAASMQNVPWTKEDEAIFVIYQKSMDGCVLESILDSLILLYAPRYGRIMYARGSICPRQIGYTETEAFVSEQEALEEALLSIGAESLDDIELLDSRRVYSYRMKVRGASNTWVVDPCWRFDYSLKEADEISLFLGDRGSVLIDAVDGQVSSLAAAG